MEKTITDALATSGIAGGIILLFVYVIWPSLLKKFDEITKCISELNSETRNNTKEIIRLRYSLEKRIKIVDEGENGKM